MGRKFHRTIEKLGSAGDANGYGVHLSIDAHLEAAR
jgi:hypothetical protein